MQPSLGRSRSRSGRLGKPSRRRGSSRSSAAPPRSPCTPGTRSSVWRWKNENLHPNLHPNDRPRATVGADCDRACSLGYLGRCPASRGGVAMTKHARFAPSAASRWLHCPGSVSLSEAIGAAGATGEESEYAQEGVRAHQLAAQALSFALDGVDMLYADDVPEEMQTAIALYVSTVMAAVKPGDKVEIEKQYAIDDDLWGTTDAVVFHAADHTAEVFDFKY